MNMLFQVSCADYQPSEEKFTSHQMHIGWKLQLYLLLFSSPATGEAKAVSLFGVSELLFTTYFFGGKHFISCY